jgi:hypothetical protein
MKKVILFLAASFSILAAVIPAQAASPITNEDAIAIPQILMFEDREETLVRRCVNDNGCRPGVEICAGGYCVPDRGAPPSCRVDRECTPRRCVNGRCQY